MSSSSYSDYLKKYFEKMKIKKLSLKDACLIKPEIFKDNRGYFFESFNQKKICHLLKIKTEFIQDNQSISKKNVLRGIHFQIGKHSQAKILSVINGSILDVIVDLRPESKTFMRWLKIKLNNKKKRIFIYSKGICSWFSYFRKQYRNFI